MLVVPPLPFLPGSEVSKEARKLGVEQGKRERKHGGQAATMTGMCDASLPGPELIAVTDHIRLIRAAATARHISLGASL
ncbi:hypothetical protein [Trebonia sp.]|uniref:hypothetical protein n=1 Tax=Trebonia sp. TaxID=2767075 RepID=UPI0026070C2A|nr:hypothetical protein [Trebonia sp.]